MKRAEKFLIDNRNYQPHLIVVKRKIAIEVEFFCKIPLFPLFFHFFCTIISNSPYCWYSTFYAISKLFLIQQKQSVSHLLLLSSHLASLYLSFSTSYLKRWFNLREYSQKVTNERSILCLWTLYRICCCLHYFRFFVAFLHVKWQTMNAVCFYYSSAEMYFILWFERWHYLCCTPQVV